MKEIGKFQKNKNNNSKPAPTPIEQLFIDEAKDRIPNLEREEWFGDTQKPNKYRVDFIIKPKKVVIELDGHGYHSTKEQREADAKRQRYIEMAGYRVIRFTGREIYRDAKKCVDEVIEYLDRVNLHNPINRKIMYIDSLFLDIQFKYCLNFYQNLHPHKKLCRPKLVDMVIHIIEWLHLKADFEVFVFAPRFWSQPSFWDNESDNECDDNLEIWEDLAYNPWETDKIDNKIFEYERGTLKFEAFKEDFVAISILEHLQYHAHYYDNFVLVADDPCYRGFLDLINSEIQVEVPIRLARLNDDETTMWGFDNIEWQNIWYMIGTALGLKYELDEL